MRFGIARDSLSYAAVLVAAAAAAGLWRPWAALVPLAALGFVLWFFRDPERRAPASPRVVLSPADGRVVRVAGGRVSIFLSLMNVHVCRSPLAGSIESIRHTPGRFLAAFRDAASEHNERVALELRGEHASLRLTLVAGLVARRIVSWVREGQRVAAGERLGIIRFGSRADIDLPQGTEPAVAVGDRVIAGESVIARLPEGRAPAETADPRPRPASDA